MALSRDALSAHGWSEDEIAEWLETAAQLEVDDALDWKQLGVSAETAAWYVDVRPSVADDWLDAGFAVEEMVRCHRSRVTLRLALQWRAAGRPLDETISWASHGFGPEEPEDWKAQGHDVRSAHYQRQAPDPASR